MWRQAANSKPGAVKRNGSRGSFVIHYVKKSKVDLYVMKVARVSLFLWVQEVVMTSLTEGQNGCGLWAKRCGKMQDAVDKML